MTKVEINSKFISSIFSLVYMVSIFVLLLTITTKAQDTHNQQNYQTGIPFSISDIESINNTNGNLMFNFGFGNVQGRGAASQGIGLKFNSKMYKSHVMTTLDNSGNDSPQNFVFPDSEGGWQYDGDYRIRIIKRGEFTDNPQQYSGICPPPTSDYGVVFNTKLMMYFPDGSQHEFRPTGYSDSLYDNNGYPIYLGDGYFNVQPNGIISNVAWGTVGAGTCSITTHTSQHSGSTINYYSTDGTFMRLEYHTDQSTTPGKWTLYMPDGSKVSHEDSQSNSVPQRVYDKNGNYVEKYQTTMPDGSTGYGYIDDVGRYVVRHKDPNNIDIDYITKKGFGGEEIVWTVKWKTITVIRKYTTSGTSGGIGRCCYSNQVHVSAPKVVDEIILPDQLGSQPGDLKYKFTYDAHEGLVQWNHDMQNPNVSSSWGEIKDVTLPSGAKAEYDFHGFPATFTEQLLKILGKVKEKRLVYNVKYDGNSTPMMDKWIYDIRNDHTDITRPDGGVTSQYFYRTDIDSEASGTVYKEVSPSGAITEKIWKSNKIGGCPPLPMNCGSMHRLNLYVKTEFTTIPDNAGNPSLTAIKDLEYDKNGNVTKITEYDWVNYSTIPRDSFGKANGIPSGATKKRINETAFYNPTENASIQPTDNVNGYWNGNSQPVNNAAKFSTVKTGTGTPVSHSEITYDNPNTTANPTSTKVWDSSKGVFSNPLGANSISSSFAYDPYGNPTLTTDAKGVQTQITYGSINGYSGLYPTQTKTALGLPEERTSTATYDFDTGLPVSTTDVDNNLTNATEYDDLGRPTKVKAAVGEAEEIWTTNEYDVVQRRVISRSDLEAKGDGKKVSVQHFDELGRVRLTRAIENIATEDPYDEEDGIKVQTRYRYDDGDDPVNSNGVYTLTSNPYRATTSSGATNEDTIGWSVGYSDKTGRYSEMENFSGASLPAPWGNNTNSTGKSITQAGADATTVTDASGRQKRSITNALGQLTRIDEPDNSSAIGNLGSVGSPNQATSYKYNTLGKMIEVTQGVQKRHFLYDSLGRLLRVRQPEQEVNSTLNKSDAETSNTQWTAGFTFDDNGNVLTATDAENKTITTTYDNINRPVSQNYSDGITPNVTYTYDDTNVAFSKGRLTKVSNSISTTQTTEFDIMGRPKVNQQITDGTSYQMKYVYNLSGQLIEEEYPSGRKVKNDFDANGDIERIYGNATPTAIERTYANSFAYTADGRIQRLKIGNNRWESAKFNSNLQVTELALGTSDGNGSLWKLNYEYGELNTNGTVDATKNTGNVAKQTINFDGMANPFVQTYKYDSLYRITEAKEMNDTTQTWKQTYGYDKYGNRTAFSQDVLGDNLAINSITLPTVDTNTNRFNASQGYEYDKIGNLKKDVTKLNGVTESRDIKFNGDNKQIEIKDTNTGKKIGEYFYDGSGKRVKKRLFDGNNQPLEDTIFVYSGDKLVAEYSTQPPPTNPTTKYVATDTLGSVRAITDQYGEIVSRRDFMPFGEELQADATYRKANLKYNSDDVRQKFTGYQKDEETGLDFAEARMYNNSHARFTAVDPLLASGKSANPQSFNRYAYVMNNPLKFTDPDGLQSGNPPDKKGDKQNGDSQKIKVKFNVGLVYGTVETKGGYARELSVAKSGIVVLDSYSERRLNVNLKVQFEDAEGNAVDLEYEVTYANNTKPDPNVEGSAVEGRQKSKGGEGFIGTYVVAKDSSEDGDFPSNEDIEGEGRGTITIFDKDGKTATVKFDFSIEWNKEEQKDEVPYGEETQSIELNQPRNSN